MNYEDEIEEFFKTSYVEDSLAYIGLTTKVEHAFRDQFAFYLYKQYPDKIIAREYSGGKNLRTDLAVIDPKTNEVEHIEFKACYAFDLIKINNKATKEATEADFNKYDDKDLHDHKVTIIRLSIRTNKCPQRVRQNKNENIVKYQNKWEGAFRNIESDTAEKQKELSLDYINKWFPSDGKHVLKAYGSIELGSAFGVEVSLDYYIIQENVEIRNKR